MFILAQLIATPLARIFVGYDVDLFELTRHGFRIYCTTFLVCGLNIYGSSFFTALNNGLLSALISFLRTLVFQVSAVLILPIFFAIDGIWSSVLLAELLTLVVTAICIIKNALPLSLFLMFGKDFIYRLHRIKNGLIHFW